MHSTVLNAAVFMQTGSPRADPGTVPASRAGDAGAGLQPAAPPSQQQQQQQQQAHQHAQLQAQLQQHQHRQGSNHLLLAGGYGVFPPGMQATAMPQQAAPPSQARPSSPLCAILQGLLCAFFIVPA